MKFQYSCECGHTLQFAASSAGTTVPCLCGRQVKIPRLSDLKRLSGMDEEPVLGIADHLRLMYLERQLPPDTHCVVCQVKTAKTLECWVECERARVQRSRFWDSLFVSLISPIRYVSIAVNNAGGEVHGNDLVVRAPLAICENCLHSTSRSESNLRKLLLEVGLYRKLLEAYPGARVGAG